MENQTLLSVQCGANIDFDRLRYISERTQIGEKREAVLAVTIDEKPGSFKHFVALWVDMVFPNLITDTMMKNWRTSLLAFR